MKKFLVTLDFEVLAHTPEQADKISRQVQMFFVDDTEFKFPERVINVHRGKIVCL